MNTVLPIPSDLQPDQEIIAERTITSKKFHLGGNKRRVLVNCGGAVHVPSDSNAYFQGDPVTWSDVDLTWRFQDGLWSITNAWYTIEVKDSAVEFTYTSKRGPSLTRRLKALRLPIVQLRDLSMDLRVEGRSLYWDNVVPGLSFILIAKGTRVDLFKVISNASVPHYIEWEIERDEGSVIITDVPSKGQDNAGRRQVPDVRTPGDLRRNVEIVHAYSPKIPIGPERVRYRFAEEITGKTWKPDPTTRVKELTTEIVYPLRIDDTISEDIPSDRDDGMQDSNYTRNWNYTRNADDHMLWNTGTGFDPGYRFTTVAIAQGSTVSSATLTHVVQSFISGTPGGTIYGDDVDDAPQWPTDGSAGGPSDMTNTTASTAFTITGAGSKAHTITAIVDEIVNRGSWATGNAMRFGAIVDAGGYCYFDDFAGAGTEAKLDVTFTEAGGALLVATVSASGAITPALTTEITLAAAISALGAVTPALTTEIRLAAALSGSGVIAAALTTEITLASGITATGVLGAALTTEIRLAAGMQASASVSPSLTTAITMAAVVSGSAIVTADLTTVAQILLAANVQASGNLIPSLTTAITMASVLSGTVNATSALTTEIRLVSVVAVTGSLSGALTTEITLAGIITSSGTVNAGLTTEITLAAVTSGSGNLAGDLTIELLLNAALSASGTLTADLFTEILLRASLTGTGVLTGELLLALITNVVERDAFFAQTRTADGLFAKTRERDGLF